MPKKVVGLSDTALKSAIKKALESGKSKLITAGDVPGLYLQVKPSQADGKGSTAWVLRYIAGTKEDGRVWRRDLGLGGFPDVGLAEAREIARSKRRQLREGIDPLAEKRAQRVATVRALTFDEAAKRLIEAKRHEWKNAKHAEQWRTTIKQYASPIIGSMPVDQIDVAHVESVLAPIWATKTETASRVRMRIEAVLAWATVAGHRSGDNPARWRGNLQHVLAKPSKVTKRESFPALPYAMAPEFMQELRKREGVGARALEFLALTAARSGEVRGATWAEIDLDAKAWTIPADRMKADREHRIPLCPASVALLRATPRHAGTDLVFPGIRGGTMSDATLGAVLDRMSKVRIEAERPALIDPKTGRTATAHGMRSTFRDWAAEQTAFPNHVVEQALAHTIGNAVEAAYRRGDLFDKRRKLMHAWCDYLRKPALAGEVVPIRKRVKA